MKKYQLMAPGPTPVPSEVLLAMAQPILHHRTPEYEALFIEVLAGLKRLVGLKILRESGAEEIRSIAET